MSYALPPGNAVDASWQGASAYTLPPGNAADVTWETPGGVTGLGEATLPLQASGEAGHGVSGTGQGHIPVAGSGDATFTNVAASGVGSGAIPLTGEAQAWHGVAGVATGQVGLSATGGAGHGVSGAGTGAINCTATGAVAHGVAGSGSAAINCTASGHAIHERYEVQGEVREGGVLVNRRVRAYLRSTGVLVGQADTVVGKFNIHTGFTLAEHYITPIDLSEFAADWLPPTANRIVPVLAYDLA